MVAGINNSMQNSDLNVGVVVPPNKHYKPVLFSDREASDKFTAMNREIKAEQKLYSFEDTKKTPTLVKWLAGITGLGAVALFLFSKFKK